MGGKGDGIEKRRLVVRGCKVQRREGSQSCCNRWVWCQVGAGFTRVVPLYVI